MSNAELQPARPGAARPTATASRLDLPLQFLLLATRDRTGRPMGYHHYGFGAAMLAQMVLHGHARLERKRLAAAQAPADPLYATVWHDLRARPNKKASSWVSRLSGRRYRLLRRQFTHRLVDEGLLHEVPAVFGVRYPSRDGRAEDALRRRIQAAVEHHDTSDPQLVCLVAITVAAGSSAEIHPDWRMRRRIRRQAKRWMKGDQFAKAVGELIAGITAAVVASTVAATSAS